MHERLKFFLWHMLAKTLLTHSRIKSRIGSGESIRVLYGLGEETETYLFKECEVTKLLAF